MRTRSPARAHLGYVSRPRGHDWSLLGCALGLLVFVLQQLGLSLPLPALAVLLATAIVMVLHGTGWWTRARRRCVQVLVDVLAAREIASAASLCGQAAESLSEFLRSPPDRPSGIQRLSGFQHRAARRLLEDYEWGYKTQVLSAIDAACAVGGNVAPNVQRIARAPRGYSDLCHLESQLWLVARRLSEWEH